ncbi:MAG: carboxyvinyl-carboxyphosphonate phosphorylmutase [Methylococcus sp.]|nr:MAG: carboxyvinyl-carboxyphosphonate phosphorylmutase [Methylococcus sp.]
MTSSADKLRELLDQPGLLIMPGCHDAISAKLIEAAGFDLAFMSGFAVSGSRIGSPDTGLISYGEMVDQGRNVCAAVSIPVFGDGDTGYGNSLNIKRTVQGYAAAGFSCIMLEDQLAPKRCGHTKNKAVVDRNEALNRIQAAVDSRNEGKDILIMARTDARATHGLDEAIARAQAFAEIGADVTFVEAPETEDEMKLYCDSVPGPKMANMIEFGKTPNLPPEQLAAIGYKIAVYPLTLLNTSILAMQTCLQEIRKGQQPKNILDFEGLKSAVGFPEYYEEETRYPSGS